MLIFLEVWAAVSTVCAVFFWSERRAAKSMVTFLLLFLQEKTKHTPQEVRDFADELDGVNKPCYFK